MTRFMRYTEYNDHEGETWTFWLQVDGNEDALGWLNQFLETINADDMDPAYQVFADQVIPEEHVDVLTTWGGEGYMALHNKVTGKLDIPADFAPDDLYKGRIEGLFTP